MTSPLLPLLLLGAAAAPLAAQGFGPLAQPPGPAGPLTGSQRPPGARTVIESDDGASFQNADNSARFQGHVKVADPQFDLTCDQLDVTLRPDRKGLQKVLATGNVVFVQERTNDKGDMVKSVGKCGRATYDATTGDVTMEDWPQIQQGINNQVATAQSTVMIINAKGKSRTIGGSRTVIADQGGGDHPVTP
jgi:lipopolysaccharide transport protein LptA